MLSHHQATALVITSIHAPNEAMRAFASGCRENGWSFFVAGDSKSPADFALDDCHFLSLTSQRESGFSLAALAPEKSYTRKNIGYLAAMRAGATVIVETDDDNHPRAAFWAPRQKSIFCRETGRRDWVNAYQYFTDRFIYPRGMPLPRAKEQWPISGDTVERICPIQQGLADHDPDVDAVYRMLYPLPFDFERDDGPIMLDDGAWCPFNSQNTTFFAEAFPLLYLPAFCSFRMTDIWRSFVAQRIMHEMGHGILFHGPTVWQERNDHDLQRDFHEEIPGYTHNARMREKLVALDLKHCGSTQIMMERCYEVLMREQWVGMEEERLLQSWFQDIQAMNFNA